MGHLGLALQYSALWPPLEQLLHIRFLDGGLNLKTVLFSPAYIISVGISPMKSTFIHVVGPCLLLILVTSLTSMLFLINSALTLRGFT